MKLLKSILGDVELAGDTGVWRIAASSETPEAGVELIRLKFSAQAAAPPPKVSLKWSVSQRDMQCRWHPSCRFDRNIPPDWSAPVSSSLASSIPLMQFLNLKGENRVLIAVSDALRQIDILAGVDERTNKIAFEVELFSVPEASGEKPKSEASQNAAKALPATNSETTSSNPFAVITPLSARHIDL